MTRDFKAEHDELTTQYYQQGNPDGLTPGRFLRLHDSIWVDMEEEAVDAQHLAPGPLGMAMGDVAAKRKDIEERARTVDRKDVGEDPPDDHKN